METFPRYWPFVGNLVIGEFPAQRPVTRVFDVFFGLRLNDRFIKQLWGATVMKWTIHTLSTHKGSKYLAHQTNNPCCQLYAMLQNRSIYLKVCVLYADMQVLKYVRCLSKIARRTVKRRS